MFYYNYFKECRKNRKELSFIYSIKFIILLIALIFLVLSLWFAYQEVQKVTNQKALNRITEVREGDDYLTQKFNSIKLFNDRSKLENENEFITSFSDKLENDRLDVKKVFDIIYDEATNSNVKISTLSVLSSTEIEISGSTELGDYEYKSIQTYMEKLNQHENFSTAFPTYILEVVEGKNKYSFGMKLTIGGESNENK